MTTWAPSSLAHVAIVLTPSRLAPSAEASRVEQVWNSGDVVEISSDRLVLRDWRESDLSPWAAMNADPEVREHLGPPLTADHAVASVRSFQHDLDHHGSGFWAVEVCASGTSIVRLWHGRPARDPGRPSLPPCIPMPPRRPGQC